MREARDEDVVGRTFAELEVGASVEEEVVWTPGDLETFARLSGDVAPLHRDPGFAQSMGYEGVIVFGMLAAAPFSRLLGCRLPGKLSVFHSLRIDFAGPIYLDERIRYRVELKQLSPASRTAVLEVKASRLDGTVVLRGQAQCGLRR